MTAKRIARRAAPAFITLCALAPAAPAWALTDEFTLGDGTQTAFGQMGGTASAGVSLTVNPSIGIGDPSIVSIGGSIDVTGSAGVGVSAGTSGGTAAITLPVVGKLSASANYLGGGAFTLTASGGLNTGSAAPVFSVKNAGLQAGVSANASISASASLQGCVVGSCSTTNIPLILPLSVSGQILGADTTKPNPITVLGVNAAIPGFKYNLPTPITFGPLPPLGIVTVNSPQGASGGHATSTSAASFSTSQPVFSGVLDAANAFGLPNGTIGVSAGPISLSFTGLDVAPHAIVSLNQQFLASTPIDETLTFSKPVTETVGGKPVTGTSITLGVSDPSLPSSANLTWAGTPGQLLSRTYSVHNGTLTTTVDTPITFGVGITALKGSIGIGVTGIGSVSTSFCALCVDPTKTIDPTLGTAVTKLAFGAQTETFGPIAQGVLSADAVSLAARTGDKAPTALIGVTNRAGSGADGLEYQAGPASPAFKFSGGGALAPLASKTNALTVGLNTSKAGAFRETDQVLLRTDGVFSGLGASALPSAPVTLSGDVYAAAKAQVAPEAKFGVVHVGDAVRPLSLNVANGASGALTDVLDAKWSSPGPAPFGLSGSVSGLIAGATSKVLGVSLDSGKAGFFSEHAAVSLVSHDSELADLSLPSASVLLTAQVNNYARAGVTLGGPGVLTLKGDVYTLDLGRVYAGTSLRTALDIGNIAAGPADALGGTLAQGPETSDGRLDPATAGFSGLAAGGSLPLGLDFTALAGGAFSDVLTLNDYGTNDSGYKGALAPLTFDITADVAVPEPRAAGLLGAALVGLAALRRQSRRACAHASRIASASTP